MSISHRAYFLPVGDIVAKETLMTSGLDRRKIISGLISVQCRSLPALAITNQNLNRIRVIRIARKEGNHNKHPTGHERRDHPRRAAMDDESATSRSIKEPSYADAIIPLITLAVLIGTNAINGPLQVGLIFSSVVAALIIQKNSEEWAQLG